MSVTSAPPSLATAVAKLANCSGPTRWLEELLALLGSERSGPRGPWQCPGHRDSRPSLSLDRAASGAALLHCHAGCTADELLALLDLRRSHLFTPPDCPPAEHADKAMLRWRLRFPPLERAAHPEAAGYRLEAVHPYGETFRLLRYRHPTTGVKAVEWERRSGSCWVPGLGGTPIAQLPLYRETEARMAVGASELLVIAESESSVDAICHAGIYATTWAGGASSPNLRRLALMRNATDLVLCPDNDAPGLVCARRISEVLPNARLLLPPPGQDARDLLEGVGMKVFITKSMTAGGTP